MGQAALAPIPSWAAEGQARRHQREYQEWLDWIDNSIARERAAVRFTEALLSLAPDDRLSLMETMFHALRPGMPIVGFDSLMGEAYFWADHASRSERKAYALACVSRMSQADRASFIAYISGGTDA